MLGPVFRHEMVASGRKRRYHLIRCLAGLFLLLLLWISYQGAVVEAGYYDGYSSSETLSIAARSQLTFVFFSSFVWMTLIGVLGVTPAIAAGAIATERERRTIEYLFATDLSNAEIVLDKLFARLFLIGQLVLGTLPILAIFRLLGGVPGDYLLLHFAALASTAFLAASLTLLISAGCEKARDSVSQSYGALFFWFIAPGLCWQL